MICTETMYWKKRVKDEMKTGYAVFLQVAERLFGLDAAKKLDVFLRFRKLLNLKDPQTLAEKVVYISLHALPELAVTCTDKWEARRYVAENGLEEILIPVCAEVVSAAEDVDFDALPDRFVLKATHGCNMNYVCEDKTALNQKDCLDSMKRWLKTAYGTFSVEPHYRKLPHRIFCEEYIGSMDGLLDYKIHCLNGKPSFILVCSGRVGSAVTMDIFDLNWNWLDAVQTYKRHVPGIGAVPRPRNLEKMLRIAETLSQGFDFVRVDLYNVDGRVYFGELTFTPANGVFPSYKQELLEREGKKLNITGRTISSK